MEEYNITGVDMNELCDKLQTGDRRIKIAALEWLCQICNDKDKTSEQLMNTFDDCYLHLLKCYSDRFESVREKAVETVNCFITRLPPNDFHLTNIVATLVERMGQQETLEDSEEIRYLYISQMHVLIKEYIATGHKSSLRECYPDFVCVLAKSVRDAFPNVQREACACIVSLATAAETYDFQPYTEQLAVALYTMLNHKHSVGRAAAVQALSRLSLHINANGEALSRLIMEVSPLLMDSSPLVRRECGEMGVLMLLELRDRYSYFERIIPLVLCCLKDESCEVVKDIRPLWIKCGQLYYEENEAELNKQEIADSPSPIYPSSIIRPTIGCRGLVQRSLRLLTLITRETSDWKENVRLHSLKLLYQFVLHAEASMTAKFFEIYSDVARSCRDTEKSIKLQAYKVADLMGRLLKYEDWIEHGLEGLEKNAKEGYIKCFYYMFSPQIEVPYNDLLRLAKLMESSDFSQTLNPEIQFYVINILENILNKAEKLNEASKEQIEQLEQSVYVACMKSTALSRNLDDTAEQQYKGMNLIRSLACRQKISENTLHEKYLGLVLIYVENLDADLDENSEPILLLKELISIASFRVTYLKQLEEKIATVWKYCQDNAKLKIFNTISLAMLRWSETINRSLTESTDLLQSFVVKIIEPHLKWQPGAAAESMRSMATANLLCICQGATMEAKYILPRMTKYVISLLEDRNVATRQYAVKIVRYFPELPIEELKPLAYATLQRMDDPSADIRAVAAAVLTHLKPLWEIEPPNDDSTSAGHEIWATFMERALDMILLHFEGPDERLRDASSYVLQKLSEKYANLVKDRVKCAIGKAYNTTALEQLLDDLQLNDDE